MANLADATSPWVGRGRATARNGAKGYRAKGEDDSGVLVSLNNLGSEYLKR